ncbi:MAG: hypothetical protein NTV11_10120 [Rhodocyclales bacterium]|nr:hypothetical protein [Rhodocyclales bacterium]
MWRDDPIDEPWYALDFQMTRWHCPAGLPAALLEEVIEAIREMDHIVLETMKLVDRFSYGIESSEKRYIPEAAYEVFRGEFELAEERFVVTQHGLKTRWTPMLASNKEAIDNLPAKAKAQLANPEVAYSMKYSVSEVMLEETFKQFLSGIHPDKETFVSL